MLKLCFHLPMNKALLLPDLISGSREFIIYLLYQYRHHLVIVYQRIIFLENQNHLLVISDLYAVFLRNCNQYKFPNHYIQCFLRIYINMNKVEQGMIFMKFYMHCLNYQSIYFVLLNYESLALFLGRFMKNYPQWTHIIVASRYIIMIFNMKENHND